MTDTKANAVEWLRKILGHQLPGHVAIQTGENTNAPVAVFADAYHEVGDGTWGPHASGRRANGPRIPYFRSDVLVTLCAERDALQAKLEEAVEALSFINDTISWEINPSNYSHQDVCDMNEDWIVIGDTAQSALASSKGEAT